MTHMTHDLTQDFPELADRIHALKATDAHFARLCEGYDAVNQQVHRAETRIEPMSEAQETELRRTRARLKDQVLGVLSGDRSAR